MKKSELIKIIKEEVSAVLREEEDEPQACKLGREQQRQLARQIGSKTALYEEDQLEEIYNVLGCKKFMKKVYNPLNVMRDSLARKEALEKYLKTSEYKAALRAFKENQKIVNQKR